MKLYITIIFVINIIIFLTNNAYSNNIKECNFSFGVVPQFEHRKIYAIWNPILIDLSKEIKCNFKLVGSKDIPEFEKKFLEGDFDFAYMNPYHLIIANKKQGYIPIIRSNNKNLQGILVIRKDSNINNIKDLDGTEIAFPSPNALGSSLLIRAELKNIHNINIKPIYVGNHTSVYLNTLKKLTNAGGGVLITLNKQQSFIKDNLKILYKTKTVNSHPIAVHPRINKEIVAKFSQAFVNLDTNLLSKASINNPIEAFLDDYKILNTMNLEKFSQ